MKKSIACIGMGVFLLSACSPAQNGSSNSSSSSSSSVSSITQVKLYEDPSHVFSFEYPSDHLTLKSQGGVANLTHAISFSHPDPCDFKDGKTIPLLTDFSVKFESKEGSLSDVIAEELHWTDDDKAQYMTDGELMTQEGFIEEAEYGEFEGYAVIQGVEGCGHTQYFLQETPESPVLVVTRKKITELSDIVTNSNEYKALLGVILPEQEEELFEGLMHTLQ